MSLASPEGRLQTDDPIPCLPIPSEGARHSAEDGRKAGRHVGLAIKLLWLQIYPGGRFLNDRPEVGRKHRFLKTAFPNVFVRNGHGIPRLEVLAHDFFSP